MFFLKSFEYIKDSAVFAISGGFGWQFSRRQNISIGLYAHILCGQAGVQHILAGKYKIWWNVIKH
jgi:hypothetical protein